MHCRLNDPMVQSLDPISCLNLSMCHKASDASKKKPTVCHVMIIVNGISINANACGPICDQVSHNFHHNRIIQLAK